MVNEAHGRWFDACADSVRQQPGAELRRMEFGLPRGRETKERRRNITFAEFDRFNIPTLVQQINYLKARLASFIEGLQRGFKCGVCPHGRKRVNPRVHCELIPKRQAQLAPLPFRVLRVPQKPLVQLRMVGEDRSALASEDCFPGRERNHDGVGEPAAGQPLLRQRDGVARHADAGLHGNADLPRSDPPLPASFLLTVMSCYLCADV